MAFLYYSVKILLLNIKTNIMKLFGIFLLLNTVYLTVSIPYNDIIWDLPRVFAVTLALILGYGLSIYYLNYKR